MTMASIAFGIPEGIHRIDPWPFEHMAFTRGFFWERLEDALLLSLMADNRPVGIVGMGVSWGIGIRVKQH